MGGGDRARHLLTLTFATSLCLGAPGCRDRARPTSSEDAPLSLQDSLATDAEVRASLSGELAPKQQSYSYRGLYAGMTRTHLEGVIGIKPVSCTARDTRVPSTSCAYDASLGPDSAQVRLDVAYGPDTPGAEPIAREISVTRGLPLNVDGVRLARMLSDAFEQQTALLDRRDATYGHHEAHVRMGTLNGARQNFVELTVAHKAGREMLTLTLIRGAANPVNAPPRTADSNATHPAATP